MYLRIDENDFGGRFYKRCLVVNGVEKQFKEEEFVLIFEEELNEKDLSVTILFENEYLKQGNGKKRVLYFFEFLLELIFSTTDYSSLERNMGKPYGAKLSFTCKNTDHIKLHTNDFFSKKPFTFYKENVAVESNAFVTPKGDKSRWFLWTQLSKCLLLALIILILLLCFISSDTGGKIVVGIFLLFSLIGASAYAWYLKKLLRAH